jgi:hypothetical protein
MERRAYRTGVNDVYEWLEVDHDLRARLVVRRRGFELPVICTPEELMGGEE